MSTEERAEKYANPAGFSRDQVSSSVWLHIQNTRNDFLAGIEFALSNRGLSESELINVEAFRAKWPNDIVRAGEAQILLAIIDRLTNQKEQVGGG